MVSFGVSLSIQTRTLLSVLVFDREMSEFLDPEEKLDSKGNG